MRGIDGAHVVVAGGASGMGAATVDRLLREGARVSILDRDVDGVRGSADDRLFAHVVDIVDPVQVDDALAAAVAWGGPFQGAINTAGMGFSATIADQTVQQFRRVYEVNVFGMYNLVKAEGALMRDTGGSIVTFASTNSRQPAEALSAYASSKAAVESLTAVAAMEFAAHGIRVTGVAPALAATPMVRRFLDDERVSRAFTDNILLGRPADPAEIAALAVFLVSDDASYLTGQTFFADGGSLLQRYPTLAERTLAPTTRKESR